MAADHLTPGRRSFLTALDQAVRERGGMSCGIVPRGGTPVLHVINAESPHRFTEVGVDFIGGARTFTWAQTGDAIGAANAPSGAAETIAHAVGVHLRVTP